MKSEIQLSKTEVRDIKKLIINPDEISNIFNIKSSIKTYGNIERLDGYVLAYLGKELNEMIYELVDELAMMERDIDRKEMLSKMVEDIKNIKNDKVAFLNIIVIFHRLNKKMNKYLLN